MQVDLIEAMKKYLAAFNILVIRVEPPFADVENFDYGLRREMDPAFDWQDFGSRLITSLPPSTLTFTEDTFGARYAAFAPPGEQSVVLIGPWRGARRTEQQIEWVRQSLTPKGAEAVSSYYDAIPQVDERPLIGSIVALVQMLYPADEFQVQKLVECKPLMFVPDSRFFSEPDSLQHFPAALLEQRYAAENAFMDAVASGDANAAMQKYQQFCRFDLGERFRGTLRLRKNELIILNTLLRKAIERSGVHPYYLDAVSTKYSYKIETISCENEFQQIQNDMLNEYCTYVRRYSLRQYSPPVQKTLNYINLHLDQQLSLKSLAAECFISPSYLSNLFKQETGSTLTDYINWQRVQRAAGRLIATNDSIAAIAGSVGFWDVNYFTKIFKKLMGVTPTHFRRERRV